MAGAVEVAKGIVVAALELEIADRRAQLYARPAAESPRETPLDGHRVLIVRLVRRGAVQVLVRALARQETDLRTEVEEASHALGAEVDVRQEGQFEVVHAADVAILGLLVEALAPTKLTEAGLEL